MTDEEKFFAVNYMEREIERIQTGGDQYWVRGIRPQTKWHYCDFDFSRLMMVCGGMVVNGALCLASTEYGYPPAPSACCEKCIVELTAMILKGEIQ